MDELKNLIESDEFKGYKNEIYQIKIHKLYEELDEEKKRNLNFKLENS